MKLRYPSRKFIFSSLSILIAIAILLTVVPAAYAEGDTPLSPIPGFGRPNNNTLIRMHKQEGSWYVEQENLIKQADTLSANFQTLIDAQKKAGKDVSTLESGLAAFQSELFAVREIHLLAGSIIYSLVGFKANGDVRDRLAAGQSLTDGRATLKDAHVRLNMALMALTRSYKSWRHARIINPVYKTPTPIPTATKKP